MPSFFHTFRPVTIKLPIAIITLSLFLLVIMPFSALLHAVESEEMRLEEKQKVELEISKHQINIRRLHEGLQSQQEMVEHTLLQEKGVLAELEAIDYRLNRAVKKLADLQSRMAEQHLLISGKEEELIGAKKEKERVQNHLQNRMQAYYKLGTMDLINITFSTQTLPELLRFHDSFQTILKYDQELFINYRDTIEQLEGIKEALTLEQGLLEEFISQAETETTILHQTKTEKEQFLVKVKSQAQLHQQTVREIEQAREDLTQSLIALKKKEELFDQGFLLNKTKHLPPVEGIVISRFNEEKTNAFGMKRKNPGISFAAADGTKIRGVYDGTVVYAGYLKGYGNTIILDHGYEYYTVTSRIERLLVSKGDTIQRNGVIGIMGATATLIDDGLYFEIRLREKPLNPLDWLNRNLLTFADQ